MVWLEISSVTSYFDKGSIASVFVLKLKAFVLKQFSPIATIIKNNNSLFCWQKYFRARKTHENYLHEYNCTTHMYTYTRLVNTRLVHVSYTRLVKNFFNSICTKIIVGEIFCTKIYKSMKANCGMLVL